MDRLTAAQVFVDVAYTESFTATAERLDMSRPMVTRYIEAMEHWLQTRLLHRTTRRVSLTTAGERCLAEVETWLRQADGIAILGKDSAELTDSIRLATSMSFGFAELAPIVARFMALNPKVHIDIDLQDSVADLIGQRIDLAIRIASNPDPSLIGKPIGLCESVLVASPDYLKGTPDIVLPEDLQHHACLGYKNFERHVWHLQKAGETRSIDVQCRLTANEATTLMHAALNGAGIAMQPTYLVENHIESGELIRVLSDWKLSELKIYALYSSRKHLSPTVRAFIDFIERELRQAE